MTEANPLAVRRTELIWEGKYDDAGRRVAPLRVELPFQTVEMVNESAQDRQKALSLFESPGAYLAKEWRNQLIWGDTKYVLPSLLANFAAKVNLICIDPPFRTEQNFSFTAEIPDYPAAIWCENASVLTGENWSYLKVKQSEYVKLQADAFADLSIFGQGVLPDMLS